MNSRPKSRSLSTRVALVLAAGLTAASTTQAQSLIANAQLTGKSAGGGAFDYTITLNNTSASTSPIETFWYAWVPGAFYLPTVPTSVTLPTGWTATFPSAGGATSIEFVTTTAPIAPGSSLDFSFVSTDTPASLAGDSSVHPGVPVGTSFVYSGGPFSGASEQFIVQSVPEPSSLAVLLAGSLGLLIAGCRRKAVRPNYLHT